MEKITFSPEQIEIITKMVALWYTDEEIAVITMFPLFATWGQTSQIKLKLKLWEK